MQLRDKGPIEDYQALFTQNATFNIPKLNIALTSSAQIAQRAAQAIKNKKTIHMITSTDIQASGQSALSSTAHFILYMSDKNDLSAATKIFNGRYIDSLIIDKGRCLIANRNVLIDRVDTLH
ncbi:hypothetical protein PA25_36660 [Pseudoalteromonas sp. A25]|nr:hypothetical protein PA25_36660 [Pseudoalteromonas sp. A25]